MIDRSPKSWTRICELGGTHGCYAVLYRWHLFFRLNAFDLLQIRV